MTCRKAVDKTVRNLSFACGYRCGYSQWISTLKGGPAAHTVIEWQPLWLRSAPSPPQQQFGVQTWDVGFRVSERGFRSQGCRRKCSGTPLCLRSESSLPPSD